MSRETSLNKNLKKEIFLSETTSSTSETDHHLLDGGISKFHQSLESLLKKTTLSCSDLFKDNNSLFEINSLVKIYQRSFFLILFSNRRIMKGEKSLPQIT